MQLLLEHLGTRQKLGQAFPCDIFGKILQLDVGTARAFGPVALQFCQAPDIGFALVR